jgi:hypothetical protein
VGKSPGHQWGEIWPPMGSFTWPLTSPGAGQLAAWTMTVPGGTLVLGFLYFLVVPVLDLGYGISGDGPPGLSVMVFGYVVAAVVNAVLVLGVVTLCRELRDGRRRARTATAPK